MKCIGCGNNAMGTAEIDGIEAAFCCSHAPLGYARVKIIAFC